MLTKSAAHVSIMVTKSTRIHYTRAAEHFFGSKTKIEKKH